MENRPRSTTSLTSEELEQLIARRRLRQASADGRQLIPRRDAGAPVPLSFAQQRLWFLEQLDPRNTLYNMPAAVRLEGRLSIAALEHSLGEIERRHEMLRARVIEMGGEPVQEFAAAGRFSLPVVELGGLPVGAREDAVQSLAAQEARRPFSLTAGPLWRLRLLRVSPSEHVLLLVMHHIASDGWSVGKLFAELAALYGAYHAGRPSPLAGLPIQYGDYASWQRGAVQEQALGRQLDYWRRQLAGAPAALALPTDRPRAQRERHEGARVLAALSPELARGIRDLAAAEGATPFMALLCGFAAVLSRYSGQEDMCVGTPVANRGRAEVEGLIGFFVNTLVVRVDASGGPTLRQLLARVREAALGAYDNQDVPFEQLVRELQTDRSTHSPLFQIMFGVLNMHVESLSLPGLRLSSWEPENRVARFDLALNVSQTSAGMLASVEYKTALFDATTAARLLAHYRLMLERMVADPDRRVGEVPLLTESERHQLLVEWACAAGAPEGDGEGACLPQLLEAQAQRTPQAVAVTFEGGRLTYQELNERANRLARHLQSLGVGHETRVAVCVERSLEMVVAILGVFKSGGAFVPLDPDYPADRIAFMLGDAQAAVLLTQERLLPTLPAHAAATVCLDADWEAVERQPSAPPVNRIAPHDLAYVIYTSGTTGNPKGVMVEHGGLVNCLAGTRRVIGFTSADVVPCMASFSFDIFLFELFSALVVGGRVMLIAREHVVDIPQLAKTLEGATFVHAVPSLMRQLVRYVEAGGLATKYAGLTRALVGGDQVPPDLLSEMRRAFPSARVIEAYGPTEAAIICSLNPADADPSEQRNVIGRPIAGAVMRLCDAHGNPVPVGVAGEIYIGGRATARGYLGREELTRRQFLGEGAERFYRTGDLGRYLADGLIEFLGRADGQVKIRGFRIELGEVEAALNRHEGVQEAVVVAREDTPGDKRLVAYFVPRPGREATAPELQRALRESLPEFMVPSAFVAMEALPLTAHRKVDRRALPAPDHSRPELEMSYVAPRDEVERTLADIWAELLSLERVGVHDNFFQLGGHSLLATQLVSRVRETFQTQVPLRDFFESPTVAALARVVNRRAAPETPGAKIEAAQEDADLDELIAQIDQLSEEEVMRLLAEESAPSD